MTTTERQTAHPAPIDQVAGLLEEMERRVHRLLAAGWRNAGDDLDTLAEAAASLTDLGLIETAGLVRAVAAADDPVAGVGAAGSTLAACRLLRVRLAPNAPPVRTWSPLTAGKRATSASRLLALGRFALGDGEVWSCLRLQSGYPVAWVLIEPPNLPDGPERAGTPWFVRPITGRLRWQARLPLGAAGEVEVCALDNAAWAEPPKRDGHVHTLEPFLEAIRRGQLEDEARLPVGSLTLAPLDPGDLATYTWPDPATAAALVGAAPSVTHGWLLVWTASAAPIALVSAPPARTGVGRLRDAIAGRSVPRVIHLVPGLPSDVLPDPPTASD